MCDVLRGSLPAPSAPAAPTGPASEGFSAAVLDPAVRARRLSALRPLRRDPYTAREQLTDLELSEPGVPVSSSVDVRQALRRSVRRLTGARLLGLLAVVLFWGVGMPGIVAALLGVGVWLWLAHGVPPVAAVLIVAAMLPAAALLLLGLEHRLDPLKARGDLGSLARVVRHEPLLAPLLSLLPLVARRQGEGDRGAIRRGARQLEALLIRDPALASGLARVLWHLGAEQLRTVLGEGVMTARLLRELQGRAPTASTRVGRRLVHHAARWGFRPTWWMRHQVQQLVDEEQRRHLERLAAHARPSHTSDRSAAPPPQVPSVLVVHALCCWPEDPAPVERLGADAGQLWPYLVEHAAPDLPVRDLPKPLLARWLRDLPRDLRLLLVQALAMGPAGSLPAKCPTDRRVAARRPVGPPAPNHARNRRGLARPGPSPHSARAGSSRPPLGGESPSSARDPWDPRRGSVTGETAACPLGAHAVVSPDVCAPRAARWPHAEEVSDRGPPPGADPFPLPGATAC